MVPTTAEESGRKGDRPGPRTRQCLTTAERQDLTLGYRKVVNHDVEMKLLRCSGIRPCRRSMIRGQLEGQS